MEKKISLNSFGLTRRTVYVVADVGIKDARTLIRSSDGDGFVDYEDAIQEWASNPDRKDVYELHAGVIVNPQKNPDMFVGSHIAHKEIISCLFPCRAITTPSVTGQRT